MTKQKSFSIFVVLLAAIVLTGFGCSSKTVKTVKVTGKITIDGNPIEQGSISFIEIDGKTPTGGGSIKDGTYIANVPPGNKKVTVLGTKLVGTEPEFADVKDSPMRNKYESVTPPDYSNVETTPLKAEIIKATNDLHFDLSSKVGVGNK